MKTSNRVLITAGPNREYIDAIHYLGNESSGALGAFTAEACLDRGLEVVFVHGPGSIVPRAREGLRVVPVTGVLDLLEALRREIRPGRVAAVFHAMAVSDYIPAGRADVKTRSGMDEWVVRFVRAPKVIAHIKQWDPEVFLAACKLEYRVSEDELVADARELARRNGAALVVANDYALIQEGGHRGLLVTPAGLRARVSGKREIARAVAAAISEAVAATGGR